VYQARFFVEKKQEKVPNNNWKNMKRDKNGLKNKLLYDFY